MEKATNTGTKKIGIPKTQEEKYNLMSNKNPNLEKLKKAFGLEVTL